MNDEVQWFGMDDRGRNNACTCPYCRDLFRQMYHFELPQPEEWDGFYDHYENPAFVAWKRFKLETNARFVRDVNRHYESLGLKLLRPNYVAHILYGNPTAHPFEACADVWDFVFQENCTYTILIWRSGLSRKHIRQQIRQRQMSRLHILIPGKPIRNPLGK
jgi:hypothetical protein